MKKILTILSLPLTLCISDIQASTDIVLGGVELRVDTVYHAKIGPGTTRTQLHLSGSQPLDVHYITVNLKNTGVKLRATRADSSNGLQKTSDMAKKLTSATSMAIAGVNGDFYDVTSTYPDGSTRPRMTTYTTIVDNEILHTSPQAYQFIVDNAGVPLISSLDFSNSTISIGTSSVSFGGVNVESINYSGDAAPDNAVTLYNEHGWKSPYQTQFAGNCAEVSAIPVEISDEAGTVSGTYKITSAATSTGNSMIPEGGCVLLGRGTGADFINSLSVGDIVTIDCKASVNGSININPVLAIGGNPRTVSNNIALESDGTRPDAVELHPRTGVGINADGSEIVMMVVDGRGESVGVTTRQLGDLLVYAGVSEGLNFDGGGSSTCWTQPFGVINTCSDSSGERTVADALFVTAEGDVKDTQIAEIRFEAWRHEAIQNSSWTPVILAYNAAGILINTDLKGCILDCPQSLGEISSSGAFLATGKGSGIVTAKYNGLKAETIVSVREMYASNLVEEISDWNVNASLIKNQKLSKLADGIAVDYTMGTSTGSASLTMVGRKALKEDSEFLKIVVKPTTAAINKLVINLKAANSSSTTKIQYNNIPLNQEYPIQINLKEYFDIYNTENLPITFVSMVITPGDAAKTDGRIEFPEISSLSPIESSSAIDEIFTDNEVIEDLSEIEYYDLTGIKVNNPCKGLYIRRQGSKVSKIYIK